MTDTIAIYFGAPTYQDEPEGRQRKADLEKEFGVPGEEASIGTGAEGPGVVFFIDLIWEYGVPAYALLSVGKDVTELIQQFSKALKSVKNAIPQSLLIDGQNPIHCCTQP
jgi:hypothetical protein